MYLLLSQHSEWRKTHVTIRYLWRIVLLLLLEEETVIFRSSPFSLICYVHGVSVWGSATVGVTASHGLNFSLWRLDVLVCICITGRLWVQHDTAG